MSDALDRLKAALADRCSTDRHVVVSGRARVFLWGSGMNRRVLWLIIGSLLLPLGCGGNDDINGPGPPVLRPSELCSDYPDYAIATFEDANLTAAIRTSLSLGGQEPLTCGLISGLTGLNATDAEITSLVGIQNLTSLTLLDLDKNSISDISGLSGLRSLMKLTLNKNSISDISGLSGLTSLTWLSLSNNSISDISALSGLTSLTLLDLYTNSISDISALSGLTSLTHLYIYTNSISDISALSGLTSLMTLALSNNPNLTDIGPLLDNTGLGAGDTVYLQGTSVSCSDVAALQAKGVTVYSDCS